MANPLFNMLFKGTVPSENQGGQTYQAPSAPPFPAQKTPDMQETMQRLRSNPAEAIRNAGYNVPDEIVGNPQATVMHLIQSGQVGGQAMQRIQPMLNMLMGRR